MKCNECQSNLSREDDEHLCWPHRQQFNALKDKLARYKAAAEQMPKWTYCKDAMPTEEQSYLATCRWQSDTQSLHIWVGELYWNGKSWENPYNGDVSAWMPMPGPAREKK